MLTPGLVSIPLFDFIKKQNQSPVVSTDQAIMDYCKEIEKEIFKSIKGASITVTITIPSGAIQVTGPGGPSTNPLPLIVTTNNVVIK